MVQSRYKTILYGKGLYREVELSPDAASVSVGTNIDCDFRLRREQFFCPVNLYFRQKENQWIISCSEDIYLTTGGVEKLLSAQLQHGSKLEVHYQASDNIVFALEFVLDFDYNVRDYGYEIDISGVQQIKIGCGADSTIRINSEYLASGFALLQRDKDQLIITGNGVQYGISVNGTKIAEKASLHNCDFFTIADAAFYYKNGRLYTDMSGGMIFTALPYRRIENQSTHFTYPKFNRSTRIQYRLPEGEVEIQQPMPKPQKPKKRLLVSLIPSICMLLLMVVLRGVMGNGGMFVIYSVCSMGIGIVMSVVTYRMDGKEYQEEDKKREKEYLEYISAKEGTVLSVRQEELETRRQIYESLENSVSEVQSFGQRIYEKGTADTDFLSVYLGRGTIPASVPVKFNKQEFVDTSDPISLLPEQIEAKYRNIIDAPIVSEFNRSCGIGVVGEKSTLYSFLQNMVLDVAIRHFYGDVKLCFVVKSGDEENIRWVRWLRHVYQDSAEIRNIMCDDESGKIILEALYSELSLREAVVKESEKAEFNVHHVVFVLDSASILKHPISKYIENCGRYGFTFVFFEEYEEFLPRGCTEIIRLNSGDCKGSLTLSENGKMSLYFEYQPVSAETAGRIALRLGSIEVDEVSLESELTKNITLFELLNILSVEDLDLKSRWEKSQVYRSMAAPLGVKTKGEVVSLDIGDKSNAHGPHGLVAGTTGSGKSEILQTYVLSMATLFHPYDVGFVIIDFKGGGMANQFKGLPHLMGTITNIDGREIDRSLLSIKAELVKRQSLFAAANVNHINDYIKLYKAGSVKQPLPHLIIIVDEFAELKAEYPDFMKELISAARIGRTLGVHLILATQKPAGVVDAQIWSNSKFKLCLKVQTKEDSNEVIKTPLAAEIVEPGRAYFQVGNNEIFELFQSAYSGAKVIEDGSESEKAFSIYSLNDWGKKTLVYTSKQNSSSDSSKNQLQAIVDHISRYCLDRNIEQLGGICLPSLEDIVRGDGLYPFEKDAFFGVALPIGLYDDPEHQTQDNFVLNLTDSNTFIIGSAMTGKTTMLQTILLQAMANYSPSEINAYIIDCGNMALKVFESSNHVGGVALIAEEERITNLFKLLFRTIEERKRILSERGLGTHRAYVEAGFTDMPLIVLMIDNLAAFREYYDTLDDDLLSLSREGTSLGISIVATSTQTNAMNYKMLANFGNRIALVCNDSNEYMNLFDRCRVEPKDTAGRGLCVVDKHILEFQTALCVDGDKEYIRVENIRKKIAEANAVNSGVFAPEIPEVPAVLTNADVRAKWSNLYEVPYAVPVGMAFESVEMVSLDLGSIGYFAISGRDERGRVNLSKQILHTLQQNILRDTAKAFVFDDAKMSLEPCKDYGYVENYSLDEEGINETVELLSAEVERRSALLVEKRGLSPAEVLADESLLVMVIGNRSAVDLISKDAKIWNRFKEVLSHCAEVKICVIFSNVDNVNVGFNVAEIYKMIKENRKVFMFEDAADIKFLDINMQQQKQNNNPLKSGDAFMCFGNKISRIRTIEMTK